MVKNSNKLGLLAKRKLELDHAIKNEQDEQKIARRVENVRSAALAVLKKCRGPFAQVNEAPGNTEWKSHVQKWNSLSADDIIKICSSWPDRPNTGHVQLIE